MRLSAILIAAVFVVFASLALRHVGESYFLADQADQLQSFERLLRLEPYGLWGSTMSGTNPQARSLGPLPAVLFGLPVSLGFDPDATQVLTSLMLVLGALAAFLALSAIDPALAWAWLIAFAASGIVWWNAAMLWSVAILLPTGCVLLAVLARCLARPSIGWLVVALLIMLLAMHTNLVAIAAATPIAVVAARVWRAARQRPLGRRGTMAAGIAAAVALGPYLLAEAMTASANSRAMIAHLTGRHGADAAGGQRAATQILQFAADPTGTLQRLGLSDGGRIAVAASIAALALAAWALRRRSEPAESSRADAVFWLVAASVAAVAGQAVFFLIANRPVLGMHYIAVLAPLYVVAPAALFAAAVDRLPRPAARMTPFVLGVACVSLLVVRGPAWAETHREKTNWTFTNITSAIDTLCAPVLAVRTVEGPGLASATADYDPVLKYLITRRFVSCRYDETSGNVLFAAPDTGHPPVREDADGTYRLLRVVPPGIALYRRSPQ